MAHDFPPDEPWGDPVEESAYLRAETAATCAYVWRQNDRMTSAQRIQALRQLVGAQVELTTHVHLLANATIGADDA